MGSHTHTHLCGTRSSNFSLRKRIPSKFVRALTPTHCHIRVTQTSVLFLTRIYVQLKDQHLPWRVLYGVLSKHRARVLFSNKNAALYLNRALKISAAAYNFFFYNLIEHFSQVSPHIYTKRRIWINLDVNKLHLNKDRCGWCLSMKSALFVYRKTLHNTVKSQVKSKSHKTQYMFGEIYVQNCIMYIYMHKLPKRL